jgi:hypothetical protein
MNAKLRKEAEDLGIAVDSRWSDTTLSQKIDEKKADNKAAEGSGSDVAGPSEKAASGAAMSDDGKALKVEATPKAVHSNIPVLDEKTRLIITAQELNIIVDDKWDVNRLRGEIQMAREGRADLQVKGAVPPEGYGEVDYDAATKADKAGTPVKLKRAYWNAAGDRVEPDTKLHLTKAEAQRLISAGVADRDDPLP